MVLSNKQKYEIALYEQRLRRKRREMFAAKPRSVDWCVKLVVVDRMRAEVALMKQGREHPLKNRPGAA